MTRRPKIQPNFGQLLILSASIAGTEQEIDCNFSKMVSNSVYFG